jgi:hypothetical protein
LKANSPCIGQFITARQLKGLSCVYCTFSPFLSAFRFVANNWFTGENTEKRPFRFLSGKPEERDLFQKKSLYSLQ